MAESPPDFAAALAVGQRMGERYALVVPRAVLAGREGDQLAHRAGSSIEFMDHRAYEIGDDLRHVDWSAYARTGRLIVKRFREEVSPRLELLIDGSRSMDLAGSEKASAAVALAAALATAAGNAGFACRAALAGDGVVPLSEAGPLPAHWHPLRFDYAGTLDDSLDRAAPIWSARTVRAVVSDLLWPGDPLLTLRRLSQGAASLLVIQVLAAQDADPPSHGSLRLVDSESGTTHELYIDAAMQQRYRRRLDAHHRQWEDACRQSGAVLVRFVAEPLMREENLKPLLAAGAIRVV